MKLSLSHYGYKSFLDAKFESGSSSSFGDMTPNVSLGRKERVIKSIYPRETGLT